MAMIVDIVIMLLLAGSISYGYMVSRRVNRLMRTLKDLEPLVNQFSTAVTLSQDSVSQLKDNLEAAEQAELKKSAPPAEPAPEPAPVQERFATRRGPREPERSIGTHAVRNKKELVQAFFKQTAAAGA